MWQTCFPPPQPHPTCSMFIFFFFFSSQKSLPLSTEKAPQSAWLSHSFYFQSPLPSDPLVHYSSLRHFHTSPHFQCPRCIHGLCHSLHRVPLIFHVTHSPSACSPELRPRGSSRVLHPFTAGFCRLFLIGTVRTDWIQTANRLWSRRTKRRRNEDWFLSDTLLKTNVMFVLLRG